MKATSTGPVKATAFATRATSPVAETAAVEANPGEDADIAADLAALKPVLAPTMPSLEPPPVVGVPLETGFEASNFRDFDDDEPSSGATSAGSGAASAGVVAASAGVVAASAGVVAASADASSAVAATVPAPGDAAHATATAGEHGTGSATVTNETAPGGSPAAAALGWVMASRRNQAITGGALLLVLLLLVIAIGRDDTSSTRVAAKPADSAREGARGSADDANANTNANTNTNTQDDRASNAGDSAGTANGGDTAKTSDAAGDTTGDTTNAGDGSNAGDTTRGSSEDPATGGDAPTTGTARDDAAPDRPARGTRTGDTRRAETSRDDQRRTDVRRGDTGSTTKAEPARPPGKLLGGKPMILEYDGKPSESVKSYSPADQAAIGKARVSTAAGNQRLLAGDGDSALRNYQQALAYYPGYVAAYRGLGLAYEKKGDKAKAVQALRTYVGNAPSAKDAGAMKQRIASLQSK